MSSRVAQTVYLVMISVRPANPGDPNTEVYAAKLTHGAARRLAEQVPGSWVEKVVADKA